MIFCIMMTDRRGRGWSGRKLKHHHFRDVSQGEQRRYILMDFVDFIGPFCFCPADVYLYFLKPNGFVRFFSFVLERQRRLHSRKACLFHAKTCLFYQILGLCPSVSEICFVIVVYTLPHRTGWSLV